LCPERNELEISAAYNEWAETYDTVENRTRDLAAAVLRKVDLNLVGRDVVEVGCGTGRNTQWLAQPAAGPTSIASIVGLDFSAEMLERARVRVNDSRVRFVQHDVRAPWPLADHSAEVVIAMLILEHVEHLEPVFAEAARVLRRGGELFICELHPERQLLGGKARFTNATGENTFVAAFLHLTDDYVRAGTATGFEVVKLDEWRDEDAPADPPRILSVHFRRRDD